MDKDLYKLLTECSGKSLWARVRPRDSKGRFI